MEVRASFGTLPYLTYNFILVFGDEFYHGQIKINGNLWKKSGHLYNKKVPYLKDLKTVPYLTFGVSGVMKDYLQLATSINSTINYTILYTQYDRRSKLILNLLLLIKHATNFVM